MTQTAAVHKQREIRFARFPKAGQAFAAAPRVTGMEGVHEATPLSDEELQVGYDLLRTSLRTVEERLLAEGYHLDTSLLSKLKRALHYYTEEVERENLGLGSEANTKVYVNRYQRLRHDCRDKRPEHWRNYR